MANTRYLPFTPPIMVSSPITVGRMLVDADHADVAASLLAAQRALADIEAGHQLKGKGRADDYISDDTLSDEAYAIKIQEEFVQEAFRAMEDFRLAKSLAEGTQGGYTSYNIVDQVAVDHLRVFLTMPINADKPGSSFPQAAAFDPPASSSPTLRDVYSPSDLQDNDSIVDEPILSSQQAAAEHRQVLLAASVNLGLPGPSDPTGARLVDPKQPDSDANDKDVKVDVPTAEPPTLDLRQVLGVQFGCLTVHCMPCGDLIVGEPTLHAPCGHYLCVDCLEDLVTTSIRDESLYPPGCCKQPLPLEALAPFLPMRLQAAFDAKRSEFDVPASERIFCPSPTCSTFLGSSKGAGESITCTRCNSVMCTLCKLLAHPGETCSESSSMSSIKTLAKANKWQTCPQCHAIVEKTQGCNHILCRCSSNFCYGCGGRMAECKC
ncbi:hypothetical protein FPV67DRAFT_194747 [Lyophyllum atratum]|nr:hypothetical protein FPV67DRAFT_194747 [Lyophyllum atratum]